MAEVVGILGLKELKKSLRGFEADVRSAPRRINSEAARLVSAKAKTIVPRRTGRLAGSIRAAASGTSASVSSKLIYSPIIHFGWPRHHIRAVPFLYTALDQQQTAIVELYEKRLAELTDMIRGL